MKQVHVPDFLWTEVLLAADWYEAQSAGLAADLVDEINRVLTNIGENPLQYPVVGSSIRRARTKRFHYGIFFAIDPDVIRVIQIQDLRQSPTHWEKRIPKKK